MKKILIIHISDCRCCGHFFVLDLFVLGASESSAGFYVALVGVVAYGLSTLFALATLPVERDASRRAEKMLLVEGILTEEEYESKRQKLTDEL